jgi:phosphopantothenoylcysteine synthetase/decarboxylase
MKALVTSGGTREAIDPVRFITNFSTGRTGARIADALAARGFLVVQLKGEGSAQATDERCESETFTDFADLNARLKARLSGERYDLVVHLAAVSDYSVDTVIQGETSWSGETLASLGKIDSGEKLTIELKRNFKIIERIKSYAGEHVPFLVGFKLTFTDSSEEQATAIRRLAESGAPDLVVHNDLRTMQSTGVHEFHVYRGEHAVLTVRSPEELALAVVQQMGWQQTEGSA